MIWPEHVLSIATAAGKKLGYLFRIRPSLGYCSHIWGAAAPLPCLYLMQPLSHPWRAVGDISLFYRYSNGFCSSELTSIIPPLFMPARCTRGTSSSHPKAVVSHTSRTERYTAPLSPGCPGPGVDCLVMYLSSRRVLAYSSLALTNFP
nr:unnamed protein product [Callosobruchus chinensis]CAH7754032.1 unnamed protein product [Callosobruchus chinensis]